MNQSQLAQECLRSDDALERKIMTMDDQCFDRAVEAWARHDRRQRRVEQPQGYYVEHNIWLPLGQEQSDVVRKARAPTPIYPNAYRVACRSLQHCAALERASYADAIVVKYWVRSLEHRLRGATVDPRAHRSARKLKALLDAEAAPVPVRRRPRL